MNWTEILVSIPTGHLEVASSIAQMVVPYGIYIEDYSDLTTEAPKIAHIDLIDEELLQRDRQTAIIHVYISPAENPREAISFLEDRLKSEQIAYTINCNSVSEEDWATAWKKYFHPTKVGEHLVVCPSWENYSAKPGEVVIILDPGMAFGTGSHDTTRLCMQLLEQHIDNTKTVLDVGCGSGILSVSAVLLGAKSAVGCDIDGVAVRTAGENAKLNGVSDRTSFYKGDLTRGITGTYDVICANIVADVIVRLCPDIPQYLKPDGVFVISGIIEERYDNVAEAVEKIGFQIDQTRTSGGWVALTCSRKKKASGGV